MYTYIMGDGDELIIDSPINHNVLHKQQSHLVVLLLSWTFQTFVFLFRRIKSFLHGIKYIDVV